MKMYTVYIQPIGRYKEKGWQGASRTQWDYLGFLNGNCEPDTAMKIVDNTTHSVIREYNT